MPNGTVDWTQVADALQGDLGGNNPASGKRLDTEGLTRALNFDVQHYNDRLNRVKQPVSFDLQTGEVDEPGIGSKLLDAYFWTVAPLAKGIDELTGISTWVGGKAAHTATGSEYLVRNPIDLGEAFIKEEQRYTLSEEKIPQIVGGEIIMVDNPHYNPDPKVQQEKKAKVEGRLHELYKSLADSRKTIEQKYVDLGLIDRKKTDFWDEQAFSFGMNLPFLLIGSGAAKLGAQGVSLATQMAGYPLFTMMEAGSHAGDVYRASAKIDENGEIIPGTGDLDKTRKSLPFGLLAGTLEFWGVSQSIGLMGKIAESQLGKLGASTFAKEVGKIGLIEGGEEVSQDLIEQYDMYLQDLQPNIDLSQTGQAFIAGAVGGLLMGGLSFGTSVAQLKEIKEYAETVPKTVDKLVKSGQMTREKAKTLKNVSKEVLNSSIEDLGAGLEKLNEVNKAIAPLVEENNKRALEVIIPKHVNRAADAYVAVQAETQKKQVKIASDVTEVPKPLTEKQQQRYDLKQALEDKKLAEELPVINEAKQRRIERSKALHETISIANTIAQVEDIEDPNILDYTTLYGRSQAKAGLNAMTMESEDRDYVKGFMAENFIASASKEVLHEVNKEVANDLILDLTERGLIKMLGFVPKDDQKLKQDVAIGVALNFDEVGWEFVRKNNPHIKEEQMSGIIEEAQKLQESDRKFTALKNNNKQLSEEQSVKSVQAAARLKFFKGARKNIGTIRAEVHDIIGTEIEVEGNGNVPSLDFNDIQISEAISYHVGSQDDPDYFDPESLGYDINDMMETAPPPMKTTMWAAAFRLPDGQVIAGQRGQMHADIYIPLKEAIGVGNKKLVESGFVDRDGNFFTRDETFEETGVQAESIAQGIVDLRSYRFELKPGLIPDVRVRMPRYSSVLAGFANWVKNKEINSGANTFNTMYRYLLDTSQIDENTKEAMDALLPFVKDRKLEIISLAENIKGITNSTTLESAINQDAIMERNTDVWNTLVHEAAHSYLTGFFRSDSQASLTMAGQLKGVMNTVRKILGSSTDSNYFRDHWLGTIEEFESFKKINGDYLRGTFFSSGINPGESIEDYNARIANEELDKALQTRRIDEFITSILSDTQRVKWLTDRVWMGGKKSSKHLTGWNKIKRIISNAFSKVGMTQTASDKVFQIMEQFDVYVQMFNTKFNNKGQGSVFNPATLLEHQRLNRAIYSGYDDYSASDNEEDQFDDDQNFDDTDEEDRLENKTINNFASFMAGLNNMKEPNYREMMRELAKSGDFYQKYLGDIEELNSNNKDIINRKLRRVYKNYKKNFDTFEAFKISFLKRQYLNLTQQEAKEVMIFVGNREYDQQIHDIVHTVDLRRVKGSYIDGRGTKRNTYRHNIRLEAFIPKLETLLGLPTGTLQMVYLDSFETSQDGVVSDRSNISTVNPYTLTKDGNSYTGDKTALLAEILWRYESNRISNTSYLYMGTFQGKNTLPVLAFPSIHKDLVRKSLEHFEQEYLPQVIQAFGAQVTEEKSEGARMGATISLLLEDLWNGSKFEIDEQSGKLKVDSKAAAEDRIKTMSRGKKFLVRDTGVVLDKAEFEDRFGNKTFTGISWKDGTVVTRSAAFNSKDEGMFTFKYNGREKTISLKDILRNEFLTPKTDGATFYILGEFDEIYQWAHGNLKSGALKNLLGSRFNTKGLFIKHAMFGVHKDSMLGQFMISQGLALLHSDEAVKIPKDVSVNMSEHQGKIKIPQDNILEIDIKDWERIKEEQTTNPLAGNFKQLMGGIAFGDYNPVVKAVADKLQVSADKILSNVMNNIRAEAEDWFKEHSRPEVLVEVLQDIVDNPQSPAEVSVSKIVNDKMIPKEGQTVEDILTQYSGLLQHAHIAETLRNRLKFKLDEMLRGRTAGGRSTVGPNVGWANHQADVDPVMTKYAISNMMLNMIDTPSDILRAAFPEPGLIPLLKELAETQRAESRAHNYFFGKVLAAKTAEQQEKRKAIFEKIRAIDSPRINSIMGNGIGVGIEELVNWENEKVKKYQDDLVWGVEYKNNAGDVVRSKKGILKPDGSLRRRFGILTEEDASNKGLRPGDRYLAIVTPLSGGMDLGVFTLAGVVPSQGKGRKVINNGVAKFNSEWLQTIVGKDFDIDTISIIGFDDRYWSTKDWEDFCNIIEGTMDEYPKQMAETIQKLFDAKQIIPKDAEGNEIKVNKDTIFTQPEIRRHIGQAVHGKSNSDQRTSWAPMGGAWIQADSAFLDNSIATTVAGRKTQGMFSAIGLKADKVNIPVMSLTGHIQKTAKITDADGKTSEAPMLLNLDSRHDNWMLTHVIGWAETHDRVDYPKDINIQYYNSDTRSALYKAKKLEQNWGLHNEAVFQEITRKFKGSKETQTPNGVGQFKNLAVALNAWTNLMFGDALQLASGRSPETFSSISYDQAVNQIRIAQAKLAMFANNDKEALRKEYKKYTDNLINDLKKKYNNKKAKFIEKKTLIESNAFFINSFIDNLSVENVYNYPPFAMVKSINPDLIPVPGDSYKDHLINGVLATKAQAAKYPDVNRAYLDQFRHTDQGAIFKVPKNVAAKLGREIFYLLGQPKAPEGANPDVQGLLDRRQYLQEKMAALPSHVREQVSEKIIEWIKLNETAGKPYKPLIKENGRTLEDGTTEDLVVNVDEEVIILGRMVWSMDYLHGRQSASEAERSTDEYWRKQLKLVREEASTLIHAFGENTSHKPVEINGVKQKTSDTTTILRKAHESTFPSLWKALLDNPFLFFTPHATKVELFLWVEEGNKRSKEPIFFSPGGDGQLYITDGYKNRWSHNDLRIQAEKGEPSAKRIYDAITKRNGLWEGTVDNSVGSYNRFTVNSMIQLGRNIPMQNREALLVDFLNEKLYGPTSKFLRDDQIAFWLSLLAQPTDQGMRDNKGLGFIVNRAKFDPKNPYQFQNNHLILSAMSEFEPDLLDDWLRDYNHNQQAMEEVADKAVLDTIKFDKDGFMFELAPPLDTEHTLRHFMSEYIDNYETLAKDNDFRTFYKEMRSKDWKHGLNKLRTLVNSTIMLKALSENGVYYEDLVMDIKKLSDAEFYKKYSHVDATHIKLTLERYLGNETADTWIHQNAGESEVDWRARGNIISLFWVLNGVQKREKAKNKSLSFLRKMGTNILGYDTIALINEKQTHAVAAKDEALGVFFHPEEGAVPFTSGQVTDSMRPFATRGFQGTGNSTTLIVKGKELAKGLKLQRVEMNDHAKRSEDMVMLLSDKKSREAWRRKFASHVLQRQGLTTFLQRKSAEARLTEKNQFISNLLDEIQSHGDVIPEIRREQIWKIAENMLKDSHIEVKQKTDGSIFYRIELGKGYSFDTVQELINKHFSKVGADQKLALIAALEHRVLFDIKVPKYIQSMITYLEALRDDLTNAGSLSQGLTVQAMVLKYRDMLQAIAKQKGNYMPHEFPQAHYKQLWASDYLKAMTYKIELQVIAAKRAGITNKYSNLDIYSPKDKLTIKKMAMELVERRWTEMSAGWNQGKIIANFLPRKMPDATGYTRTDPNTVFNYISKLSTAMQSDALKADWLVYQKNAREAGERDYVMEITKRWMASQAADPDLYSEPISKDKVKPGMQVSFAISTPVIEAGQSLPYITDAIVSGVVRSTTKDTITLDFDKDKVLFDIKNDMRRYEGAMMKELSQGDYRKPSARSYIMIQKLLNSQWLKLEDFNGLDLKEMTAADANGFIFTGLERMIKNPEKIGVYKKSDIFSHNIKGQSDMTSINRHIKYGGVDRLIAKGRELKTLRMFDGQYDNIMTRAQYYAFAGTGKGLSMAFNGIRTAAHTTFMGLASQFKARVVNQMGATVSNLTDSPWLNVKRTREAWLRWDSIKHGNLDLMSEKDRGLYKAIVSLGLAGDGDLIAIALEAANVDPADVYVRGETSKVTQALARLWMDAVDYKPYKSKFENLQQEFQLETDPMKRMHIELKLRNLQHEWEAKINGILAKEGTYTEQEIKDAWKKVETLSTTERKLNVAKDQGITVGMATVLMGKVALKKFYTGSFGGVGFQAKAEKLRIPAFFIGYYQAIDAGFDEDQAIQFGANSVELRHALYGTSNRQLGANTSAGKLAHQFAQYQYNAAAKALRVLSEAIPQMLRVAHSRGENTSRIKHLGSMLKTMVPTLDAKGKQMKNGNKQLSEVNLAHAILNKVILSSVQMQLGTRILYGITNMADPLAQSLYHMIDFLIDALQGNGGDDPEDEKARISYLLNDILLLHGMGYKLLINSAINTTTEEGVLGGLYKGRANDTEDFLDRTFNDMQKIFYDLNMMKTPPTKSQKSLFDEKYLVDDFLIGVKLMGWTPANSTSSKYVKKGGKFGLNDEWPFIMKQTQELAQTYGGGRYVDTGGKGIDGLFTPRGRGDWRFSYLASPASYIPFIDKFTNRKK